MTGEGVWRTEIIPLHPGMNIFEWKTMGLDTRGPKPILIKTIEIDGRLIYMHTYQISS